jgi:hypothetical protein
MIFVILIFYVLPVLLLTDLLITAYKLAKGEGVLLIHAIIGVLATLIPLINLAFLILIFRAISDMSKDEMDELSKHSIVFKFLFKKI